MLGAPVPPIGVEQQHTTTDATAVRHGVLRLTFADGLSAELDVPDRMRGPVFADARTSEGFAKVAVDSETGSVIWPGGADLAQTRSTCGREQAPGQTRTWPHSTAPTDSLSRIPRLATPAPRSQCSHGCRGPVEVPTVRRQSGHWSGSISFSVSPARAARQLLSSSSWCSSAHARTSLSFQRPSVLSITSSVSIRTPPDHPDDCVEVGRSVVVVVHRDDRCRRSD